ncbi:MAG: hypothetical protein AAF590_07380 [Pseudomonadota bacterium]
MVSQKDRSQKANGKPRKMRRYGSTFLGVTLPSVGAAFFAAMVFQGNVEDQMRHMDLADRVAVIKQTQTVVTSN